MRRPQWVMDPWSRWNGHAWINIRECGDLVLRSVECQRITWYLQQPLFLPEQHRQKFKRSHQFTSATEDVIYSLQSTYLIPVIHQAYTDTQESIVRASGHCMCRWTHRHWRRCKVHFMFWVLYDWDCALMLLQLHHFKASYKALPFFNIPDLILQATLPTALWMTQQKRSSCLI